MTASRGSLLHLKVPSCANSIRRCPDSSQATISGNPSWAKSAVATDEAVSIL